MIYNNKMAILLFLLCFETNALIVDDFNNNNEIFTDSDQKMSDGNVDRMDLKAVQIAFKNSTNAESIKTCKYKSNEICKIKIRERMPTIIKLPKYEWPIDWVLGDDVNFELETLSSETNVLSLRSFYPGVDTSLNIIGGSGFIYSFYVLSNGIKSKTVSDFIVNIKADKETLEKIAQAKRFYKNRSVPDEVLSDIIQINIKNNALHTAFKKVLPADWDLNIDKKLEARDRLIDVISENKTRREVIIDLASNLKLRPLFYPKLRLLVITQLNPVIQ